MTPRKRWLLAALTLCPAAQARAQNPFEIQVYEYATVPKAAGTSRPISTTRRGAPR